MGLLERDRGGWPEGEPSVTHVRANLEMNTAEEAREGQAFGKKNTTSSQQEENTALFFQLKLGMRGPLLAALWAENRDGLPYQACWETRIPEGSGSILEASVLQVGEEMEFRQLDPSCRRGWGRSAKPPLPML